MQEIVEECLTIHDTLVYRYTQHHLTQDGLDTLSAITSKGYNRVIGQREVKWMSLMYVGPKLAAIIYNFMFTRLTIHDSTNIGLSLRTGYYHIIIKQSFVIHRILLKNIITLLTILLIAQII
jgi:hypothetical protein